MADKQLERNEKDPFLVVTWPNGAKMQVTLSFEGDMLPMFPIPADIENEITEEMARNQFSQNLFTFVATLLDDSQEAEESE